MTCGRWVGTFTGNDASAKFFYVDKNGDYTAIIGFQRYGSINIATHRVLVKDRPPKFPDKALVGVLIGTANANDNTDSNNLIILDE